MFPPQAYPQNTLPSQDENTSNKINHALIETRRGSSIFDIRSSREANWDSDDYLAQNKYSSQITNWINKNNASRYKLHTNRLKNTQVKKDLQQRLVETLQ